MACPPGIAALSGGLFVPPAGMLAIAGYCRRAFPKTRFMLRDFGAEKIPLKEQIQEIRKIDPQIIGLAARTFIFPATVRLAKAIKEALPGVRIIFGGHHPTLMPETEAYPDCFDTVVRGEGEQSFLELLRLFEADRPWPKMITSPYPEVIDHDYAWDIIAKPEAYSRSYSPFYPQAMGSVLWSRGCPFNCNFCSGPALWAGSRPRVRYRTPESICDELEFLQERYGIKRCFVHDDTLNTDLDSLKAILEEIIRRKVKMRWAAAGMRANENLTPEWLFPLLHKAGCRMISYGIESGSPRSLRRSTAGSAWKNTPGPCA
jgi:anaerobic magnesium-protoporphyrin IX monomethyl ester cyclase